MGRVTVNGNNVDGDKSSLVVDSQPKLVGLVWQPLCTVLVLHSLTRHDDSTLNIYQYSRGLGIIIIIIIINT